MYTGPPPDGGSVSTYLGAEGHPSSLPWVHQSSTMPIHLTTGLLSPHPGLIKEKLSIPCVNNEMVGELFRGIRGQLDTLLDGMSESNLKAMQLGLSHSLSRYKLKFSADKVDTMIVQVGEGGEGRGASSNGAWMV